MVKKTSSTDEGNYKTKSSNVTIVDDEDASTLFLREVPEDKNIAGSLSEHFSKFGQILQVQVTFTTFASLQTLTPCSLLLF